MKTSARSSSRVYGGLVVELGDDDAEVVVGFLTGRVDPGRLVRCLTAGRSAGRAPRRGRAERIG